MGQNRREARIPVLATSPETFSEMIMSSTCFAFSFFYGLMENFFNLTFKQGFCRDGRLISSPSGPTKRVSLVALAELSLFFLGFIRHLLELLIFIL